ncbi:hypothetical protein HMPREF1314_1312 [Bifidobacterium longum subsp. longum 35B]|nr:hypothetical protein HMPREF1314_1312 [Bifidobacterium longum subsp. longum 35B]
MSPDVQVKVREPVRDRGLVRRWRISIRTRRNVVICRASRSSWRSHRCRRMSRRRGRSGSIIPPCRRSPGTSSWRWKAPPRYSRTSFCRLHAPPISAVVTCGTCAGCRPGPTWMRLGRSGWPRSRLGNTGRSENGRRAQAGCVRSRRCCLRTPFWTRCEGSCRPECSSPPSNPSPGASTPRRRSPGCMIPPGPHGRRRMARRVSGGRCLSPTSLPPFPCGVTGVPLFPEAASSPHSHLIRSARSMGLWYGSVTSMRRVGSP